jgi:hypothetical protein
VDDGDVVVPLDDADLKSVSASTRLGFSTNRRECAVSEQVFRVDDAVATQVTRVSLAEAGLRERQHLQEWVLANPDMLGEGVTIVTSEFDRWLDSAGQPSPDRLDVLGLDPDGRLVIGELKRGEAPLPTAMQAINYAARASRFSVSTLAEAHARFLRARGQTVGLEEAEQQLVSRAETLTDEALRRPRIVLLAESFPTSLTASVVWLTEQELDITLRQIRAYRVDADTLVVTVSQLFPVPDVEEFTLEPARQQARTANAPAVPWTVEELRQLIDVANVASAMLLELCGTAGGEWVTFEELLAKTGLTHEQAKSQLAGLTMSVKARFQRSNKPFEVDYTHGTARYRFAAEFLGTWQEAVDRER